MNCPICFSQLEFKPKSGKYYCSNCEEMFIASDICESKLSWPQAISSDQQFWLYDVWNLASTYPSIIAHEYKRLNDLLAFGHTFGALLQIKDVFEILLKLPVLITAAMVYNNKQSDKEAGKLLTALLEKPLSLGDWEDIANYLKKKSFISAPLQKILKDICGLYGNKGQGISNWRNDTIGHGALGFEDDPAFQKDLLEKIFSIKTHLQNCAQSYSQIEFYQAQGKAFDRMKGPDAALIKPEQNVELFVSIDKEPPIPCYPYILLDNTGLYFFDSHFSRKSRSYILNYPYGRKKAGLSEMNSRWQSLLAERDIQSLEYTDIDNERFSRHEEEIYRRIQAVDDYQEPGFLSSWLNNCLCSHRQGIFVILMERGTGKSSFCRGLDTLDSQYLDLSEFEIRNYYINDSYSYQLEYFTSELKLILMRDKRGRLDISSLPEFGTGSGSEGLIKILYETLKAYKKFFGSKKLLLVMDGMDEIPPGDHTIWDFIPHPHFLPEGIYLLLTSRPGSELSDKVFSRESLDKLVATDSLLADRRDSNNLDQLRNYVRNSILKLPKGTALNESDMEKETYLLEKSDYRLLFLRTYKDLISLCTLTEELPDNNSLIDSYLQRLEDRYSIKYFNHIISILLVLSSAKEELTLNEISFLIGDSGVSFRLLANMNDVQGFLQIERSYRGNLYSISHHEWREAIIKRYKPALSLIINRWIEFMEYWIDESRLDENHGDATSKWDGETYLISHLLEYLSPEETGSLIDEIGFNKLARFLLVQGIALNADSKQAYVINRGVKIFSHIIELFSGATGMNAGKVVPDLDIVSLAYLFRGKSSSEMMLLEEAEADFSQAIGLQSRLLEDKNKINFLCLLEAFSSRGSLFFTMNLVAEAEKDYIKAFEICSLIEQTSIFTNLLPWIAMDMGNIKSQRGDYDSALANFNQAITSFQSLVVPENLSYKSGLAAAYNNRGNLRVLLIENQLALEDYNKAISLWSPPLLDLNPSEIAIVYSNRGHLYSLLNNFSAALFDYHKAIGIWEKMLENNRPFDENYLAQGYLKRGRLKTILHESFDGDDINKAVKILETMFVQERLADTVFLAKAYWDWEAASDTASYGPVSRSDRIWNALGPAGQNINDNNLKPYESIWISKQWARETDFSADILLRDSKVITDNNIRKHLKENIIENDLDKAYREIVWAERFVLHSTLKSEIRKAQHNPQKDILDKAMNHLNTAIKLLESLAISNHDTSLELSRSYFERGKLNHRLKKYSRAFCDYEAALNAIKSSSEHKGKIADIEFYIAIAYRMTNDYPQANIYYDQAIKLLDNFYKDFCNGEMQEKAIYYSIVNCFMARFFRSELYQSMGKSDAASDELNKTIAICEKLLLDQSFYQFNHTVSENLKYLLFSLGMNDPFETIRTVISDRVFNDKSWPDYSNVSALPNQSYDPDSYFYSNEIIELRNDVNNRIAFEFDTSSKIIASHISTPDTGVSGTLPLDDSFPGDDIAILNETMTPTDLSPEHEDDMFSILFDNFQTQNEFSGIFHETRMLIFAKRDSLMKNIWKWDYNKPWSAQCTIEKVLHRGQMSEIFLAKHLSGQRCIIKLPHARTKSYLNRESNFLVLLDHPAIPMLLGYFGDENGDAQAPQPAMIIEYKPGLSLLEHMEKHTLNLEKLISYAFKIAIVMSYVHYKDIIHRNITPSNILIGLDDNIFLIDFGSAQFVSEGDNSIQSGTLEYMSVEEKYIVFIKNSSHSSNELSSSYDLHISKRSDIFSYGKTLYHALASTLSDVLREQMLGDTDVYISPENLPESYRPFYSIILKCLHSNPEARFESFLDIIRCFNCRQDGEIEINVLSVPFGD